MPPVLFVFAMYFAGASSAQAEARGDFLYTVDCAAAFMKTAILFRAKRNVGEAVGGKPVELRHVDFWEQRTKVLVDFLLLRSDFSDEAQTQLDSEMDGWLIAFEASNGTQTSSRIEGTALQSAVACNEKFSAAKWFD